MQPITQFGRNNFSTASNFQMSASSTKRILLLHYYLLEAPTPCLKAIHPSKDQRCNLVHRHWFCWGDVQRNDSAQRATISSYPSPDVGQTCNFARGDVCICQRAACSSHNACRLLTRHVATRCHLPSDNSYEAVTQTQLQRA